MSASTKEQVRERLKRQELWQKEVVGLTGKALHRRTSSSVSDKAHSSYACRTRLVSAPPALEHRRHGRRSLSVVDARRCHLKKSPYVSCAPACREPGTTQFSPLARLSD